MPTNTSSPNDELFHLLVSNSACEALKKGKEKLYEKSKRF
jgi:hypothetical protein